MDFGHFRGSLHYFWKTLDALILHQKSTVAFSKYLKVHKLPKVSVSGRQMRLDGVFIPGFKNMTEITVSSQRRNACSCSQRFKRYRSRRGAAKKKLLILQSDRELHARLTSPWITFQMQQNKKWHIFMFIGYNLQQPTSIITIWTPVSFLTASSLPLRMCFRLCVTPFRQHHRGADDRQPLSGNRWTLPV